MFEPLEELKDFAGEDCFVSPTGYASERRGWRRTGQRCWRMLRASTQPTRMRHRRACARRAAEGRRRHRGQSHVAGGTRRLRASLPSYLARNGLKAACAARCELGCGGLEGIQLERRRACGFRRRTARGELARRQACVVTLPLGVLQRVNREGGVRMQPEPAGDDRARGAHADGTGVPVHDDLQATALG